MNTTCYISARKKTPLAVDADDWATILLVEGHASNLSIRSSMEAFNPPWKFAPSVTNAAVVAKKALHVRPNLVIIDPDLFCSTDGPALCRFIRSDEMISDTPIIIVSERATELDRILGLHFANDYVIKPFNPKELFLRIQKQLKWQRRWFVPETADEAVRVGDFYISKSKHIAGFRDEIFNLTLREFQLLWTLANSRGTTFSRSMLLDQIGARDAFDLELRTIDTYVKRMRDKIGEATKYIKTIPRLGYRFVLPSQCSPRA